MSEEEKIKKIIDRVFDKVVSNKGEFDKFLRFASFHLQYSLPELLLFYAQAPNVTAIAPYGVIKNAGGTPSEKYIVGLVPYHDGSRSLQYDTAPFYSFEYEKETEYPDQCDVLKNALELSFNLRCYKSKQCSGFLCEKGAEDALYIPESTHKSEPFFNFYIERVLGNGDAVKKNVFLYLCYFVYPPENKSDIPSINPFFSVIEPQQRKEAFREVFCIFRTFCDHVGGLKLSFDEAILLNIFYDMPPLRSPNGTLDVGLEGVHSDEYELSQSIECLIKKISLKIVILEQIFIDRKDGKLLSFPQYEVPLKIKEDK